MCSSDLTFVMDLEDPVTGEAYGYSRTAANGYQLKATFDLPSPAAQDQLPWQRDEFFSHGAGPKTFSITVPAGDRTNPRP